MKTTNGYLIPEEHLNIIKEEQGPDFNITSIIKLSDYYGVEGTYKNNDSFFMRTIKLSYIIQEIREKKLKKLLFPF